MGCRGCLVLLAIVLLIMAAIAGGTYYLLTQPSATVAAFPAIEPAEGDAEVFDDKVSRFAASLTSTSPFDESSSAMLEITEEEATAKLVSVIASQQLPIEVANPRVHFRNKRILLSVDVSLAGLFVNVATQVQVGVLDGQPKITMEKIDVGRFGTPDSMIQPIMDSVTIGGDPEGLGDLPFRIETIESAEGVLTVVGQRQPK